jgi:tRNA A-37 threonylcarbamoyl transferase component Bud32
MPARGSLQDRIACEILLRERRRSVTESVYLARILSAGINLPEKLFQMWTSLLTMEVFQESYQPEVVKEKVQALKLIRENVTQTQEHQVRMFRKLHSITTSQDDLRPASPEQIEEFRRKLRRSHLAPARK